MYPSARCPTAARWRIWMRRMLSGWRASWPIAASKPSRSPSSTATPARIMSAARGLRVSISAEVAPEIREYERASTTIANVYVQGRVDRYLRELQARLERGGFRGSLFMMLSNGGVATAETAIRFPIRLLESGPAAGALAAASYGAACGRPDLLSFDMGGTTAKFCVIDRGQPL